MNTDAIDQYEALCRASREEAAAKARATILDCAREHVLGHATIAAALDEVNVALGAEAFDNLAERLGIADQRRLALAYRRALVRAVVVVAREEAEKALDDEDHPEGRGIERKRLSDALDRNDDHIATCDDCHGEAKGCHCHGGLAVAPSDVTALAVRLRDEAIAEAVRGPAGVQREAAVALMDVDTTPKSEGEAA